MFRVKLAEQPTREKMQALVERMANGDRAARNELIEINVPLVKLTAAKFHDTGIEFEELFSLGCIGLISAIDSYDASRGAVSTYAVRCIRNQILRELRRRRTKKRARRVLSLDDPVFSEQTDACKVRTLVESIKAPDLDPLDWIVETEERRAARDAVRAAVRSAVATLPTEVQRYLWVRFGGERRLSQTEAARPFGWSQSWASRQERTALKQCRAVLTEAGSLGCAV